MNSSALDESTRYGLPGKADIVDYGEKDFREYWHGKSKELLHRSEENIINDLLPAECSWFVDIGCGFGRLLPVYQGGKENIVLLDYDVKHLKMAAENTSRSNVYYVASDACRLPFRDEMFDGGICVRLMHHIARPEVLLSEIYRILSCSSTMLFNYMNRRNVLRMFRYGRSCFRHTHERVSEIIYATHPVYYAKIAREAGFSVSSVRGTGLVHQIVHDSMTVAKIAEKSQLAGKLLAGSEHLADPLLGRLNLALMQYTKIEKKGRPARLFSSREPGFIERLRCTACGCERLEAVCDGLRCPDCERLFVKDGPVYNFKSE